MKPKVHIKKVGVGYEAHVHVGEKLVAKIPRSTKALAEIAGAREAAVWAKMHRGKRG